MNELTDKQQQVLDYIEDYQLTNGSSPTLREIREYLGVASDNSVLKHLKALEKKGYIQKDETPRGIKLLDSIREKLQSTTVSLPVLGFVPAGGPINAEEHIEDWFTVDACKVKDPKTTFMLRVTGQSMVDAGIYEGDLLIADAKKEPKVNDIVIALIDGGNTVKRLVKKEGRYFLVAENIEYPDIHPLNQLEVQGVVTGLVRSYK